MEILGLSIWWKAIAVLWFALTVILILLVLVQKGRGGGLGGAFGGAGAGGGLLGTKTGDFLTWVTIIVAGAFLLLAIVLGIMAARETQQQQTVPAQQQIPTGQTPVKPVAEDDIQTPAQAVDEAAEAIEEAAEEAVEKVEEALDDSQQAQPDLPDVNNQLQ